MYKLLQNTIIQCWHFLKNVDNIGNSNDFRDIYYLIDYLVYSVMQTYSQIPCQPQCSNCCKVSGLPLVTVLEWIIIHKYILSELALVKQTEIILQNQYLHKERSGLQNFTCAFLIDDLCSIYQVRPSICRAYGYFTIRKGEGESSMFTCYSAAEQIISFLKENGIEHLAFPVWNKFVDKIYELNKPYKTVATLPLWLFSHVIKGELVDKVNIQPNFSKLLKNDTY